jgi:hypothetical protein
MARYGTHARPVFLVAAMVLGLAFAAPASAYPPPTNTTMTCRNLTTGYDFVGNPYYDGAWRANYSLHWQRCIIKLTTGERYAKVQLTSDWSDYKWFTGDVELYFETCFPNGYYELLGKTTYNAVNAVKSYTVGSVTYEVATRQDPIWVFQSIQTKKSIGVGTLGFRIRLVLRGAAVISPTWGSMYFSAGSGQGAPPTYNHIITGCFSA